MFFEDSSEFSDAPSTSREPSSIAPKLDGCGAADLLGMLLLPAASAWLAPSSCY